MVTFNKKQNTYQITLNGDQDHYFSTLRALSRAIACIDHNSVDKDVIYHLGNLLEEMLPGETQQAKLVIADEEIST